MRKLATILRDESGSTAIEYGLIAAMIGIAAVSAMQKLGTTLSNTFSEVSTNLDSASR
jgi:pilus assembly protein Flp/PilA